MVTPMLAEMGGSVQVGLAGLGSAIGVGLVGMKASEAVGRNPGAFGKISGMSLGTPCAITPLAGQAINARDAARR